MSEFKDNLQNPNILCPKCGVIILIDIHEGNAVKVQCRYCFVNISVQWDKEKHNQYTIKWSMKR